MQKMLWVATLAFVATAVAAVTMAEYGQKHPETVVGRFVHTLRGATDQPAPAAPTAMMGSSMMNLGELDDRAALRGLKMIALANDDSDPAKSRRAQDFQEEVSPPVVAARPVVTIQEEAEDDCALCRFLCLQMSHRYAVAQMKLCDFRQVLNTVGAAAVAYQDEEVRRAANQASVVVAQECCPPPCGFWQFIDDEAPPCCHDDKPCCSPKACCPIIVLPFPPQTVSQPASCCPCQANKQVYFVKLREEPKPAAPQVNVKIVGDAASLNLHDVKTNGSFQIQIEIRLGNNGEVTTKAVKSAVGCCAAKACCQGGTCSTGCCAEGCCQKAKVATGCCSEGCCQGTKCVTGCCVTKASCQGEKCATGCCIVKECCQGEKCVTGCCSEGCCQGQKCVTGCCSEGCCQGEKCATGCSQGQKCATGCCTKECKACVSVPTKKAATDCKCGTGCKCCETTTIKKQMQPATCPWCSGEQKPTKSEQPATCPGCCSEKKKTSCVETCPQEGMVDSSIQQAGFVGAAAVTRAPARLMTRMVPVGDLLDAGTSEEELLAQCMKRVAPASWQENGGDGQLVYYAPGRCLIVRQSLEVVEELEEYLTELRDQTKPPYAPDNKEEGTYWLPFFGTEPIRLEMVPTTPAVLELVPVSPLDPTMPGFVMPVSTPEKLPTCIVTDFAATMIQTQAVRHETGNWLLQLLVPYYSFEQW